jgi:hypothetical protein
MSEIGLEDCRIRGFKDLRMLKGFETLSAFFLNFVD